MKLKRGNWIEQYISLNTQYQINSLHNFNFKFLNNPLFGKAIQNN